MRSPRPKSRAGHFELIFPTRQLWRHLSGGKTERDFHTLTICHVGGNGINLYVVIPTPPQPHQQVRGMCNLHVLVSRGLHVSNNTRDRTLKVRTAPDVGRRHIDEESKENPVQPIKPTAGRGDFRHNTLRVIGGFRLFVFTHNSTSEWEWVE